MKILDCPFIDQREKYPTGCESVSAVMLLRHFGFDVTPEEFIDRCLPKAPEPVCENGVWYAADPQHFYLGNPYTDDGWGCFAPAVCAGLRTCLRENAGYDVREVYGQTLSDLCRDHIDCGIPVIVFATMGMAAPKEYRTWKIPETGGTYTWKTPMHCLLLVGYTEDTFVFNDPLVGKQTSYPSDKASYAHAQMGMQAAVMLPREGTDFLFPLKNCK